MKATWSKLNLLRLFRLETVQKTSIFITTIGIFLVVNLIIGYLSWRIDLSDGKVHTLSPSTRKIIRSVDDVVTIKFFVSSDLPSRLLSLKTAVVDLVNEYKKQARGKIIVKIRDPKKDSDALSEAQNAGVPALQLSQIEKDKYAVSNSYFGMALNYGTKTELIPQATNIASLEYDITSAIFKLTQNAPIKVGLIGESEFTSSQEDTLYTIKKVLQQQFDLDFIDASSSAKNKGIGKAVKTVILIDDNKKQYGDEEIAVMKSYLKDKGKMIFVIDGVGIQEDISAPQPALHNLFTFFESYGVKLNRNFVLSESSEVASFTTGTVGFITPYPFWVTTSNFDKDAVEFSSISQLVFPWVASVDIEPKTGVEVKKIVSSEPKSWTVPDVVGLSPQTITVPPKETMKSLTLMVEVKDKDGGSFIILPSSRFVSERFISRMPENIDAFVNLVSNYASGGALSGIRARSVRKAPLIDLPEKVKDGVKYVMILLFPGLFGIFGFSRLVRRRF